MIDRGIIKWQPFDSCYSTGKILKEIHNKKNSVKFPILSDDQLLILEEKVIDAYHLNNTINIEYYYNGNLFKINGKINSINYQQKKLCVNNNTIYFKQIIKVF